MTKDLWNKCQECGRIISHNDFASGLALNRLLEPDSDLGRERWETLCRDHNPYNDPSRDPVNQPENIKDEPEPR